MAEKHAQTMLQLLDLVCVVRVGKPGRPEQIIDIPVPQIVEEITEVDRIPSVWSSISNLYLEENRGVTGTSLNETGHLFQTQEDLPRSCEFGLAMAGDLHVMESVIGG